MNLAFERVHVNDSNIMLEIYEIIKNCGEEMYRKYGLTHWSKPYPIEAILDDCVKREVFIAKDLDANSCVHTFQLEFINPNLIYSFYEKKENEEKEIIIARIVKFATHPKFAGKGIGKLSIEFIEKYCRNKGISKICLDVYEKSINAIQFYKNRGFVIRGKKPTRHFMVYLMEKQI